MEIQQVKVKLVLLMLILKILLKLQVSSIKNKLVLQLYNNYMNFIIQIKEEVKEELLMTVPLLTFLMLKLKVEPYNYQKCLGNIKMMLNITFMVVLSVQSLEQVFSDLYKNQSINLHLSYLIYFKNKLNIIQINNYYLNIYFK